MNNEIKISVISLSYNHEPYLRKCLDGFVMQKTNFKFEIIIHDDASTDGSAEIIREYAEKYPDIIKPILQTENQYSKGVYISKMLIQDYAQGKYIAMCEGDDFWIDENKLQKQYDYMSKNEECSFCFSNAKIFDCSTNETSNFYENFNIAINLKKENYSLPDILSLHFIPTSTYMFKKNFLNNMPLYYDDPCPGGDRKISLFNTALGYAHFIKDETSVYRINVPNSAMTKWKKYSQQQLFVHNSLFLHMYENLNLFTNNKYFESINKYMEANKQSMLATGIDRTLLKKSDFILAYKHASLKLKIKIILANYFNSLFKLILKIKGTWHE